MVVFVSIFFRFRIHIFYIIRKQFVIHRIDTHINRKSLTKLLYTRVHCIHRDNNFRTCMILRRVIVAEIVRLIRVNFWSAVGKSNPEKNTVIGSLHTQHYDNNTKAF